jgi:chaperonin cofactor prefoldin
MELAQIDEIAHRKGEIESQLKELDSAEKELKKRSGGR